MSGRSDASPLFAALGDGTRLALVHRLGAGRPLSIANLASGSGVTRQAVAKHLRVLEGAGLARGRRRGREVLWELEARRFAEGARFLERVSRRWDRALARLQAYVETPEV